jgi:DNA repair protein RadC
MHRVEKFIRRHELLHAQCIQGCAGITRLIDTIAFRELSRGTLDSASIYPREVVKLALPCNAAAVILVHNHPSGDPEPSQADRVLTGTLKDALGLVGIRTLDHVVVGSEGCMSLAEVGYL